MCFKLVVLCWIWKRCVHQIAGLVCVFVFIHWTYFSVFNSSSAPHHIWCAWAAALQGRSKYQANYPPRQNPVTPRWQKRARSSTRVVFGLVRWRSHNCLQTPPWYVGTISHATLFKGKETQTGGGEEVGGGGEKKGRNPGILHQCTPTMCLS